MRIERDIFCMVEKENRSPCRPRFSPRTVCALQPLRQFQFLISTHRFAIDFHSRLLLCAMKENLTKATRHAFWKNESARIRSCKESETGCNSRLSSIECRNSSLLSLSKSNGSKTRATPLWTFEYVPARTPVRSVRTAAREVPHTTTCACDASSSYHFGASWFFSSTPCEGSIVPSVGSGSKLCHGPRGKVR